MFSSTFGRLNLSKGLILILTLVFQEPGILKATTLESGTLTLEGNNTLGAQSLTMGAGTTLQSGVNNLAVTNGITLNGSDTVDVNGNHTTLWSLIGGPGGLSVIDSATGGVLFLRGYNIYSGPTTVGATTLNINGDANLGTSGQLVFNGGILQAGESFATTQTGILGSAGGTVDTNGQALTWTGTIEGVGGLAVTNTTRTGILTLTGVNTYGGGTTLNGGILNISQSANLGTGNQLVFNGGTLQAGAGFTMAQTGVLGSAGGTVDTNGQSLTMTGTLSGAGGLTVKDSTRFGILVLGANNTYTGGTVLESGTLDLAKNGALGTGVLMMETGTTLQAGVSNLSVTNTLFMSGADTYDSNGYNSTLASIESFVPDTSLTKIGLGTLTLSGNNDYDGGTNVNGGTLVAANSGSLGTGPVSVNNGTLAIAGYLTVNVNGNYTQGPSGALQLGLGSIQGQNGALNVAGSASLSGALNLIPVRGFEIHDNEAFTLLTANSVSGTFTTLTKSVGGVDVSILYNPDSVVLDLLPNTLSFKQIAQTSNQQAVGGTLDGLASHSQDPGLISYLNSRSNSDLPAIYDQLSPSSLTPIFQMGFSNSLMESRLIDQRLSQVMGDNGSNSRDEAWDGQGPEFAGNLPAWEEARIGRNVQPIRLGGFVNGLDTSSSFVGAGSVASYKYSGGGTMAGMDYRFGRDFAVGLWFGYNQSGTSQSAGNVGSTGGQAGVYAGWKKNELRIDASVAGGVDQYATQRETVGGTAVGSSSGFETTGQAKVSYDMDLRGVKVSPYGSSQYTQVNLKGFTESGSLAPLSYPSQTQGFWCSELGAAFSKNMKVGDLALSPSASVGWNHMFQGYENSLSANFGSVLLIGGANMSTQFSQLTRKPRLIIGTPGRVIDHLNRGSLSLSANGFLVLDEADRMLDMGFAPQLDEIRKKLTGHRQTLLFSATIPPNIQQMASKYLKDPVRITIGSGTQPIQKIAQKVLYTTEAKKPEELSSELKERQGSILIFARTQHRVDRIMNRLKEEGVKVTRIHGGRSQSQRKQAIDQFREGKFLVLVATDIAARGLDIHHIAHVINYDLPRNPEDYIHRVGRTARAGAEGDALCFLTPEDRELWQRILKLMGVNSQSIPVKPSRFGFTAPKEDAAPRPRTGRPAPHGRSPQRHDRPQGGRPSGRPQEHGAPHVSHSRPPHRPQEGQGFQGGHREAPSKDFAPRHKFEGGAGEAPRKNRRPDGRHQQRSEMHHRKFGEPQGGFPDQQAEFNEADEKQPMSNASRTWGKPVGFMQALGRKFMGGDRSRPAKGGFSRDSRPGGFRKEGGFGGGDHRRPQGPRPHRFDNSSGGPRPFSNDRRPHSDSRPGGPNRFGSHKPGSHSAGEHRSEGGRPHRPGGGFHPKGGFKKSGPGNSRPGGFRPR